MFRAEMSANIISTQLNSCSNLLAFMGAVCKIKKYGCLKLKAEFY